MTRSLLLLLLLPLALRAADPKAGEFPDEKLTVAGAKREYRLVVPKTVDLAKPAPIVFAFHGRGIDSKDLMPKYTKLNDAAEKHKFVLVYPNAIDRSWGLKPEKVKADLAFFDALLKELQDKYKIDANRVYVTGMSNGAYFAGMVAKERSKQVAAAAMHSGGLDVFALAGGVNAERKFPILIVHGDQDKLLPVKLAQAGRDRYTKEGHEVKYVEVAGLGHAWDTKHDIKETIWEFFAAHPLDAKAKK